MKKILLAGLIGLSSLMGGGCVGMDGEVLSYEHRMEYTQTALEMAQVAYHLYVAEMERRDRVATEAEIARMEAMERNIQVLRELLGEL